jgi:hypothetical protein
MLIVFAKSNFQNGGANPCRAVASRRRMPVCLDSPQGIATFLEITFGNQFNPCVTTKPANIEKRSRQNNWCLFKPIRG